MRLLDWGEWFSSASGNTLVQFLVGFAFLVFGSNAIFSEKTAREKFGVFGLISRNVQRHLQHRAKVEEELERRRTQDLRDEIRRVDEARKADNRELRARISHLEETERTQHRYIVWVTEKMRQLEVWAAELGLKLPPPRFMSYNEWLRGEKDDG